MTRRSIILTLIVVAAFFYTAWLVIGLDTYSGTLLAWEDPIGKGFIDLLRAPSTPQAVIQKNLLWDEGLVSTSYGSLWYGVPTYALLYYLKATVFNLRIVSVIYSLLTIGAFYLLSRRFVSQKYAILGCFLVALNPPHIYYAHYGSSLAATEFLSVLILLAVFDFLKSPEIKVWKVLLTGTFFAFATLTYSPARILIILSSILVSLAILFKPKSRVSNRIFSFLLFASLLGAFWIYQHLHDTARFFVSARGEQIINFLNQKDYLKEFLGPSVHIEKLTADTVFSITKLLLAKTLPQAFSVFVDTGKLFRELNIQYLGDPPLISLIPMLFLPFFLIGLVHTIFRWRNVSRSFLILVVLSVTAPVLLTSRADIHRLFILEPVVILLVIFGIEVLSKLKIINQYSAVYSTLLLFLMAANAYASFNLLRPYDEYTPLTQPVFVCTGSERSDKLLFIAADTKDFRYLDLLYFGRDKLQGGKTELVENTVINELLDETYDRNLYTKDRQASLVKDRNIIYIWPSERFSKLREFLKSYQCIMKKSFQCGEGLLTSYCCGASCGF